MHGAQSEQWRRRYDDHPFPRTSVGLGHQSATIELFGREQAPEPSAVVCVEQDEYLVAQVQVKLTFSKGSKSSSTDSVVEASN